MIDLPWNELFGEPVSDKPDLLGAHHLIWVWFQYGGGYRNESGVICLPHKNMQAGEQASEYLEKLGLGDDTGWQFELNKMGAAVFDAEAPED